MYKKIIKNYKNMEEFVHDNLFDNEMHAVAHWRHELHARRGGDEYSEIIGGLEDSIWDLIKKTNFAVKEGKEARKVIDGWIEVGDSAKEITEFIEKVNDSVECFMRSFEKETEINDFAPTGMTRNREFGVESNYYSTGIFGNSEEFLKDFWEKNN